MKPSEPSNIIHAFNMVPCFMYTYLLMASERIPVGWKFNSHMDMRNK